MGSYLTAKTPGGDWDSSPQSRAGAVFEHGGNKLAWDIVGAGYRSRDDSGWERIPVYDLPVPWSHIKVFSGRMFITTSDEIWALGRSGYYRLRGLVPLARCHTKPTPSPPLEPTTWSQIKARYGERD